MAEPTGRRRYFANVQTSDPHTILGYINRLQPSDDFNDNWNNITANLDPLLRQIIPPLNAACRAVKKRERKRRDSAEDKKTRRAGTSKTITLYKSRNTRVKKMPKTQEKVDDLIRNKVFYEDIIYQWQKKAILILQAEVSVLQAKVQKHEQPTQSAEEPSPTPLYAEQF